MGFPISIRNFSTGPCNIKDSSSATEAQQSDKTHPVLWDGNFQAMLQYEASPTVVEDRNGAPTHGNHPTERQGDGIHEQELHPVTVHDARQLDPAASLGTHGFALKLFPSCLSEREDFEDADLVRNYYYSEVRDVVRELTGATQVGVYEHTVRTSETMSNAGDVSGAAGPVTHVHCDYTENSARQRLQSLTKSAQLFMVGNEPVDPSYVESLLLEGKGIAFINVWRSIDHDNPVLCHPLAVCDARSVPAADRIICQSHNPHGPGESLALRYRDTHKWYMYPRMHFYEALVFKVFDTQEPKFVFHTSFTDPRGGNCAPPRTSIEVRTVVFFDGVDKPDLSDLKSQSRPSMHHEKHKGWRR